MNPTSGWIIDVKKRGNVSDTFCMERTLLQVAKGAILVCATVAPMVALGQRTFTYQPSDYQGQVLSSTGTSRLDVRTTIIVMASPQFRTELSGATKSYPVVVKPPEGVTGLHLVSFDGHLVSVTVLGSNADGELSGTVNLPVNADLAKDLKFQWTGNKGECVETSASTQSMNVISKN